MSYDDQEAERVQREARLDYSAGVSQHVNSPATVRVSELHQLLAELQHLRLHVAALQTEMSAMTNAQLSRAVRAFHLKYGHPVATTPAVPDDAQMRFRAKLITEEFREFLEAVFNRETTELFSLAFQRLDLAIETVPLRVDFPEMVDAIEDMKYVLEGTHAVCGVHAAPAAAEVHRANMDKDAVYVEEKDAFQRGQGQRIKPVKPAGWMPPQIAAVLRAQGWTG